MTRLVLKARRVTFTWSHLTLPANDAWPCTPGHHNNNSRETAA